MAWNDSITREVIAALRDEGEAALDRMSALLPQYKRRQIARALKFAAATDRAVPVGHVSAPGVRGMPMTVYRVVDKVHYSGPAANSVWQYASRSSA